MIKNILNCLLSICICHAPPVYIWISELGKPLQCYFQLYRQFTITKAAEEYQEEEYQAEEYQAKLESLNMRILLNLYKLGHS